MDKLNEFNPFSEIGERLSYLTGQIDNLTRIHMQSIQSKDLDRYIDYKEVIKILGITRQTLYNYEKAKIIVPYVLGGEKKYKLSEIQNAPQRKD
ncbi:helix-turn-helix transcriptional regulator [Aquirufa nivalisilvae]|uniref:helix-turn-helix transcriptional regulator n=1 Tax=Aquirufa TaxID=2676247 RepID=UPI0022A8FC16|nr:helix-turn-helix domain-containing protein [Aquirufa nivalisilvae]MCZ2480046.1 helix-turn-helix domain-containing protein [Aquirufa nivalisilvae]